MVSPHLAQFNLIVDGQQAQKEVMDAMLECSVENSLHLPDACTLRIHDAEFKWLDEQVFAEGKTIKVQAAEEAERMADLFEGEVVALELDLAAHGVPTVVVRCLNHAHRLHRGKQRRAFEQVADSDIVNKIAAETGLTADVDATTEVRPWVCQNNLTNWEFLSMLAERSGRRLYVDGLKKLCFKKVQDSGSSDLKIEWGKDLRSFRPRVGASGQVDEVIVRGWDPTTKQAIVASQKTAEGTAQIGQRAVGGDVAKQAYGAAKMVVVDQPIATKAEADSLVKSLCDSLGAGFIEADGLCEGKPALRPGMRTEIKNIGNRFSGKYIVTSTTHTYTPAEGYSTQFGVSGKQPSTLLSELGTETASERTRVNGVVVALVTDNQDPDKLSRVKVMYPWLDDGTSSFWARLSTPMAGKNRGVMYIPEIGDEVLVAFEHGDIHFPYVLGGVWNSVDPPPEGNDTAVNGDGVNHRVIFTRIGHKLIFDDTDGKGCIELDTKGGHIIRMDDAGQMIQISTTNEHAIEMNDRQNYITISTSDGHRVNIDQNQNWIIMSDPAGNHVKIDGSSQAIEVSCLGNLTLKAMGQLSIQGMMGVSIQSPATVDIKGLMVNIN